MAIGAIVLIVSGVLTIVFANTAIPIVIQSNNDLINAEVSGVTLTNSQAGMITASGNMNVLILSVFGVLILLAGLALLVYDAFTMGKK